MTDTILIVDDEPANIDLLKELLPNEYRVKAALKGEVAVKIATKSLPNVLFLDLVMPGIDGFETLTQIRKLPSGDKIKTIIVSGNMSEDDLKKGQSLDVIGHLQKPINKEQLASLLAKLNEG